MIISSIPLSPPLLLYLSMIYSISHCLYTCRDKMPKQKTSPPGDFLLKTKVIMVEFPSPYESREKPSGERIDALIDRIDVLNVQIVGSSKRDQINGPYPQHRYLLHPPRCTSLFIRIHDLVCLCAFQCSPLTVRNRVVHVALRQVLLHLISKGT